MDREKKNSSLRYMLVLALLLCLGFAVIATGTAFGRYRTSSEGNAAFEVRGTESIYLGEISDERFAPFSEGETVEWISEGNKATLKIVVSNGTESDQNAMQKAKFSEEDLRVKVRFISGLGLTAGTETNDSGESVPFPAALKMTVTEKGAKGSSEKTASYERILNGSTLFFQNGDGWIYSFLDENGKEIGFELEGGKVSWIELTVEIDTSELSAKALDIQPKIIVEKAE